MIRHSACPVCASAELQPFFELTHTPIHVGRQWPTADAARRCPRGDIELVFCTACGLVSNRAFDPRFLDYTEQYDNSLRFSPYYQQFARRLAERLIDRYDVRRKAVIEIGCGEGDFLRLLIEIGDNRGVGFDPSSDARGREACLDRRLELIGDVYSLRHAHYEADLVCCRHALEHIHTPTQFLRTLREIVGDRTETAVYFEVPNLRTILQELSVWTIVYEHCCYYSTESLAGAFVFCGFDIKEVAECYDGQFLGIEAKPALSGGGPGFAKRADLSDLTRSIASFSQRYRQTCETWRSRLRRIEHVGSRVVAWGAGARTVGLFNTLRIEDQIPYVVDINPRKQGTYLAGTGQEIVAPDFLQRYQPTTVLVMNSVYEEEIRAQIQRLGLSAELVSV